MFVRLNNACQIMETFKRGDEVTLLMGNCIVGIGIVHRTNPMDTVQNVLLGKNRMGVLIESCFDSTCKLPVPSQRASLVCVSIDSCVIWDVTCVKKNSSKLVEPVIRDEEGVHSRNKFAVGDSVVCLFRENLWGVELFQNVIQQIDVIIYYREQGEWLLK